MRNGYGMEQHADPGGPAQPVMAFASDAEAVLRRLDDLAQEARTQLRLTAYPQPEWVPPTPGPDGAAALDVAVIGAGQAGLSIAFGLQRERITRVGLFDANPAFAEGPWVTFARMRTLRTPKHLTGPDLGVPALTPEAYFSARDGAEAWRMLHKVPRTDWQEYLDWYRRTLGLRVSNGWRLERIEPVGDGERLFALGFSTEQERRVVHARHVVLATGMDGGGGWLPPGFLPPSLPKRFWSHTAEVREFAPLQGRRVAVIGAGASAFDNAATALEAGAAQVSMFVRRRRMPRINPFRWMEQAGFLGHFHALPDERKWRWMRHIFEKNQPPPQESWLRVAHDPRYRLFLGAGIEAVEQAGDALAITAGGQRHEADFLILGTGTAFDLSLRPELQGIAERILLWRDRFVPGPGEDNAVLRMLPYLDDGFAFQEREPGTAPWLGRIHCFSYAATLSRGLTGASISGLKYGVTALVAGVARGLFLADAAHHEATLLDYAVAELTLPVPGEDPPWQVAEAAE